MIEQVFASSIEPLEELTESLAAFAQQLDAGVLLPEDAVRLVELSTKVERLANGLRLTGTAVVARSGVWQGQGDRTMGAWVARITGTSKSDAISTVTTAQQLETQPAIAAAVREGRLSPAATREVAGAVAVAPGAEAELLAQAERGSLGELKGAARRKRAEADPDPEATHRRIHGARHVRAHAESDGTSVLTVRGTADGHARLMASLRHRADQIFRRARCEGRREPGEAYLYDALVELVTEPRRDGHNSGGSTGLPVGANAKVIFRIDWSAWKRGHVVEGEVCEIIGGGPVPVSVVREAANDAFIAAVVTKGTDICSVTHLGRRPTALQVTALQWRDPECSRLGCNSTVRLEYEHREGWANTHVTAVDTLDRLCQADHVLKTRSGWMLEEGTGKRRLLPPGHPDHPLQVAVREARAARIGAAQ